MNLGAFAVVIAVARKTRSGEIVQLRRPVRVRPGPHRADDGLPVRPRRHPAARRLVRQVRHLPRAGSSTPAPGATCLAVVVGRQLGDRALLLRDDRPGDVDAARARRRPHAGPGAGRRSAPRSAVAAVATVVIGVVPADRRPLRRPGRRSAPDPRRSLSELRRSAEHPTNGLTGRCRGCSTRDPPGGAGPLRRRRRGARSTATAASTPPAAGAGRRRRLPHQPRGRAAVRRGRGRRPRRRVGASSAGPTRSWWSRPAPAAARSPAPCSPPPRRARRRCATSASSGRRRCGRRSTSYLPLEPAANVFGAVVPGDDPDDDGRVIAGHRPGRRQPRRPAARPVPASCWPTSCSTTSRSGSLERTAGGWSRGAASAPTAERWSRCSCRRAGRRGRGRPPGARLPPSAPASRCQHAAGGAGCDGPSALLDAGPGGGRRLRRPRRRAGAAPVDGVAAHLRRPRPRRRPARRPRRAGHHRARSPSTSCRRARRRDVAPGRVAPRATASTSSSPRRRRRGTSGPHVGDLAALRPRSRVGEAEALTDPTGLGAFRVLEWVV